MTITNHILAGAIIGLTVANPIVAIILAFTSHFVMDTLPHFGYVGNKGYSEALRHKLSYIVAIGTVITSATVLLLLVLHGEWFAIVTGVVAASPDAIGVYNWLAYEKHGKQAAGFTRIFHVRFHRAIQWCERPWGIWVEAAATVGLLWVVGMLV